MKTKQIRSTGKRISKALALVLASGTLLFVSCGKELDTTNPNGQNSAISKSEQIYSIAEVMPVFHEGDNGLMEYIQKNVSYPQEACDKNVEGTVYVNFIIDEQGNVESPKISKGADEALDTEALRVIKLMPKWTPAKNQGNAVRICLNLPIKFSLKK